MLVHVLSAGPSVVYQFPAVLLQLSCAGSGVVCWFRSGVLVQMLCVGSAVVCLLKCRVVHVSCYRSDVQKVSDSGVVRLFTIVCLCLFTCRVVQVPCVCSGVVLFRCRVFVPMSCCKVLCVRSDVVCTDAVWFGCRVFVQVLCVCSDIVWFRCYVIVQMSCVC